MPSFGEEFYCESCRKPHRACTCLTREELVLTDGWYRCNTCGYPSK